MCIIQKRLTVLFLDVWLVIGIPTHLLISIGKALLFLVQWMYVLRLLWNGTALGTAKLFLHQVVEYFLYYLALMKSDLTGRNQNSRKNEMRNSNPKIASVLPFMNEPKITRTYSAEETDRLNSKYLCTREWLVNL